MSNNSNKTSKHMIPGIRKHLKPFKLMAFDLDGTLSQHRSPMPEENRKTLLALREKYKLIMVGAGRADRIFKQMGQFPIDIIGNYGMQVTVYDEQKGLVVVEDNIAGCNTDSVKKRVAELRKRHGYTGFTGDGVEFHPSGCVTIPILGTKADISDKIAFDPDRSKRRRIYKDVIELFPEYNVFVGGSSSFDMSPVPYDKAYALTRYAEQNHIEKDEIVYVGDDYGMGGNDEPVLKAGFTFIKVDDYRDFPKLVKDWM